LGSEGEAWREGGRYDEKDAKELHGDGYAMRCFFDVDADMMLLLSENIRGKRRLLYPSRTTIC